MTPSEFEASIARLAVFLEGKNCKVVLDKKIPDLTCPNQLRQIDVHVEKAGQVTHFECRHRSRKENVGWIEQLIGRRTTLGVARIIAVSTSGFTKTAAETAERFGIETKTVIQLSEEKFLCSIDQPVFSIQKVAFEEVKIVIGTKSIRSFDWATKFMQSLFLDRTLETCRNHIFDHLTSLELDALPKWYFLDFQLMKSRNVFRDLRGIYSIRLSFLGWKFRSSFVAEQFGVFRDEGVQPQQVITKIENTENEIISGEEKHHWHIQTAVSQLRSGEKLTSFELTFSTPQELKYVNISGNVRDLVSEWPAITLEVDVLDYRVRRILHCWHKYRM